MKIRMDKYFTSKATDPNQIAPGIYDENDPGLYGLAKQLVAWGEATVIEEDVPDFDFVMPEKAEPPVPNAVLPNMAEWTVSQLNKHLKENPYSANELQVMLEDEETGKDRVSVVRLLNDALFDAKVREGTFEVEDDE